MPQGPPTGPTRSAEQCLKELEECQRTADRLRQQLQSQQQSGCK
jgi:hypothetical protein